MLYSIKLTYPSGLVSYMTTNARSAWSRSQAYKHRSYMMCVHGVKAELEEA